MIYRALKPQHISDIETWKIQNNTVPTKTKPCKYLLSAWLKKVNEKNKTTTTKTTTTKNKTKNENKQKTSVSGQCDSLMLLQTMANKWYKRLLNASWKSFWI